MIRLTKLADYGVMLMSHMAAEQEAFHSASSLSRAAGVSVPTVSKILKLLARKGLLRSHRGATGGYTLARPATEITVAAVIAAMEGPIAVTECTDDTHSECAVESSCRVRTNWQRINDAVRGALEQITLAEMAQPFAAPPGPAHEALVPLRGRFGSAAADSASAASRGGM